MPRKNDRFGTFQGEPAQRVLAADISILKSVGGGFVVIVYDKERNQVVEQSSCVDEAMNIIREKLLELQN